MNINWVLSDTVYVAPNIEIQALKNIGSLWGGWRTWRSCQTDNVICHDVAQAQELLKADFAARCNFFVPQSFYDSVQNKTGLQAYAGEFAHPVINHDEIIALHLASTCSDLVLLLGFDWPQSTSDWSEPQRHYFGMIHYIIQSTPKTQWVMIDPGQTPHPELTKLENFSTDTLTNVFELLTN